MTIFDKIKFGLAAAMLWTAVVGCLEFQALRTENGRLAQAAALSRAETEGLRRDLAAERAALIEREEQRSRLAAQSEELRRELEDLYNNDEPCQTWADSLLPDPVYRRLRP